MSNVSFAPPQQWLLYRANREKIVTAGAGTVPVISGTMGEAVHLVRHLFK
jgi:hypothetical protein